MLKKNGVSFEDNIDKFLDILTLAVKKSPDQHSILSISKNGTNTDAAGNKLVSEYVNLQYDIPFQQWIILILNFGLFTVNRFFKADKEGTVENEFNGEKFKSAGEYYEARNDFNLTLKFPRLAKIFIKIRMIFSEIMIMLILIL